MTIIKNKNHYSHEGMISLLYAYDKIITPFCCNLRFFYVNSLSEQASIPADMKV